MGVIFEPSCHKRGGGKRILATEPLAESALASNVGPSVIARTAYSEAVCVGGESQSGAILGCNDTTLHTWLVGED